ncbi:MAG: TRAP transporter small permease [Bacillota bacterium]
MEKVDTFLGKALEIIITACLSITVILTFVQVIFRYVLRQPITWSQEVLMIGFVYSVLFGAALAIKQNGHLQVDLLENGPKWLQVIVRIVEFIIVGFMIFILIYFGWNLVEDNLQTGQILGVLPIKKAYVYMALPISGVFMLYFHVKKVIKCFG